MIRALQRRSDTPGSKSKHCESVRTTPPVPCIRSMLRRLRPNSGYCAAGLLSLLFVASACDSSTEPGATPNYIAGHSYFGVGNYIEYVAGNSPVILTAPHVGSILPATIPDRTAASCGGEATTVTDGNTRELVLAMQQKFFERFGKYPHVIIANLSRRKLDPNRLLVEAACGNAAAVT